ncbi:MAG TPA: lipopolysaccharide heptosyltransferase II [Bacillota bacterium]|nr:lipopolysaccharide heptosyltransferase II [Bacillota bacterium]
MKILVINLMHVGDLLLVTPVLRTLRTNYPEAEIALLADAKLSDLVKYNQNINELITIDKKNYHNHLVPYMKFVREIRRRKFDLVINLHANERASFIAAMSNAKKIIGYSSWGLSVFFDFCMENRKAIKHQIHSHFDVLKEGLGITRIDDRGLEMWLDEAAVQRAEELWLKAFPHQAGSANFKVVALNIGASWPTKRWPKEYFAELADRLLEKGIGIVFLGGTMDQELVTTAVSLMQHRESPDLAVLTGKMSLLELAAVLKKCTAMVTNDSGPMHVAVAMGVPLVSMFGASPVTGFYPYNDISVVLKTPVSCHPCGKHQCETLECMYKITVEQVLEKTLEIVEAVQEQ